MNLSLRSKDKAISNALTPKVTAPQVRRGEKQWGHMVTGLESLVLVGGAYSGLSGLFKADPPVKDHGETVLQYHLFWSTWREVVEQEEEQEVEQEEEQAGGP